MSDLGYRNIWVSLAIVMPVAVVGLFILRENPEAKGVLTLISVFCAVALRNLLDNRELRKREED